MQKLAAVAEAAVLVLMPGLILPAQAREFPIGGPVQAHDMEIAVSYLVGIDMVPMVPGMAMGPGTIHLETDVHATADNEWGFSDGAWIPYLAIDWTLTKAGTDWKAAGHMLPMSAKDGPHYAQNVKMNGAGHYTVALTYTAPEVNGYYHHVDKETGVPGWWPAFGETFGFDYPAK